MNPVPTWALVRQVRAAPTRRGMLGAAVPDPAKSASDLATEAMQIAYDATSGDHDESWMRWALREAYGMLIDAWSMAAQAGLDLMAAAIHELSERVGAAFVAVGQGAGKALEAILGGSPRDMVNDFQVTLLLGVLAGAVVLSTPGAVAVAGSLGDVANIVKAVR